MFDPAYEMPIPLTQVPKVVSWLPRRRRGKKPNIATIFRWAQKGLHGVRLETIQIGGTKCTSEEALKRFFARLDDQPDVVPLSRQREREIAAAEATLDADGI